MYGTNGEKIMLDAAGSLMSTASTGKAKKFAGAVRRLASDDYKPRWQELYYSPPTEASSCGGCPIANIK